MSRTKTLVVNYSRGLDGSSTFVLGGGLKRRKEMSSFVWMKVLESAPERYDRGIRMLSGGRIDQVYERMAELVAAPGKRVLDIGCGTGGVSLACAARGAVVTGIDIDAGMLEVARSKALSADTRVDFVELGAGDRGSLFRKQLGRGGFLFGDE